MPDTFRGGVKSKRIGSKHLLHFLLLLCLFLCTYTPSLVSSGATLKAVTNVPEEVSFTVVVTTVGRAKLTQQLASFAWQLRAADFIVLLSDINATDPLQAPSIAAAERALAEAQCNNCTKMFVQNPYPMGGAGHNSRTHHQQNLPGAFIMHADDDDMYTPDAFEIIRAVITTLEPRVYIFRAAKENLYKKVEIPQRHLFAFPALHSWHPREIGIQNGGTPNGVVRNIPQMFPEWGAKIGGDAVFWQSVIYNFGFENTVLVPRVIYMVNEYLYGRLHELGIDQPKGFFFLDHTGRPLPNGDYNSTVPMLNGVPMSPNPLLGLKDRYAERGACTNWGYPAYTGP